MIYSFSNNCYRGVKALSIRQIRKLLAVDQTRLAGSASRRIDASHLSDAEPDGGQESKSGSAADVLVKFLADRIRLAGPISVAEFMSTVLGAPKTGYYAQQRLRKRPILGSRGDFITAPEFSQLMGELVGVWCEHTVREDMGHRQSWDLVELGPGSGELVDDVLRVLVRLNERPESVRCRLVEISEHFAAMQAKKLLSVSGNDAGNEAEAAGKDDRFESASCEPVGRSSSEMPTFEEQHETRFGFPVTWSRSLDQVPSGGFSIILAHEFFDALPVHKFRRVPGSGGWREVLVDYDPNRSKSKSGFFFTLAKRETNSQKAYLTPEVLKALKHGETVPSGRSDNQLILPPGHQQKQLHSSAEVEDIEISPKSVAVLDDIIQRISSFGGCCLLIDYGHDVQPKDSFRGFREHKLADPLEAVGETDLTADVDFGYLKAMIGDRALIYGPITQKEFLTNLGLDCRMNVLVENAKNDKEREYLKRCYEILTSEREMGQRFKVMAIFPKVMQPYFDKRSPVGFP